MSALGGALPERPATTREDADFITLAASPRVSSITGAEHVGYGGTAPTA